MQKPNLSNNWVFFVVGSYMSGDYQRCIDSINSMLKFDGKAKLKPYEASAIILLWIRCLVGMENHAEALKTIKF